MGTILILDGAMVKFPAGALNEETTISPPQHLVFEERLRIAKGAHVTLHCVSHVTCAIKHIEQGRRKEFVSGPSDLCGGGGGPGSPRGGGGGISKNRVKYSGFGHLVRLQIMRKIYQSENTTKTFLGIHGRRGRAAEQSSSPNPQVHVHVSKDESETFGRRSYFCPTPTSIQYPTAPASDGSVVFSKK